MGGEGKSSYARSGVDYDQLDPFKIACQMAGNETVEGSRAVELGIECLEWTRGESVYVLDLKNEARAEKVGARIDHDEIRLLGHVHEGLGTKNLVADALAPFLRRSFYDAIAQDTVAMILNDLITLGLMPLTVTMHLSVGHSDWFKNTERSAALIRGWQNACRKARVVWCGGETPTLKEIILPNASELSGSAIGFRATNQLLNPQQIQDGDVIVLLRSSGVHANGLTLARTIAKHLSKDKEALDGYLLPLSDGTTYGEALLQPTPIYVGAVERFMHSAGVHYAANITGHGWRKLMRAKIDAEYVIENIPEPHPVFRFMQEHNPTGPMSDRDAYGDLNMGAGFALYIDPRFVDRVHAIAKSCEVEALIAGYVKRPGTRRVVIKPLDIVFEGSTLAVR